MDEPVVVSLFSWRAWYNLHEPKDCGNGDDGGCINVENPNARIGVYIKGEVTSGGVVGSSLRRESGS